MIGVPHNIALRHVELGLEEDIRFQWNSYGAL